MKDEAQFEVFYETTRKQLYAYLYRILGDAALAQDLFQEAYLRLLGAEVESLDDPARRGYLFKIAANLVRDHFRRQKRSREYEAEVTTCGATEISENPDRSDIVTSALQRLSVQSRSLLWLAHVDQFDHAHIAEILGVRKGSVRVLLFRARQRMLAILRSRSQGEER